MASYEVSSAQELKLGEMVIVGKVSKTEPSLNKGEKGSIHLFKADRGDRNGDFVLATTQSGKKIDGSTEYRLIGAEKLPPPRTIGILGVHYIKVKPERSKDFEKFVVEKLHPAVGQILPDMQLLYYKAIAGENVGTYITIFAIESTDARHKYWPAGAPETEILKKAFQPFTKLATELSTYLVNGSYLEPGSGAAAIYESKEWTDFILQGPPPGFTSLFNESDLSNWKIPEGDNGHWKVTNAVIDYDAESESKDGKDLWTAKSYKDFILYVDFRIKATPWKNPYVPLILPSGHHKLDENGKEITIVMPDSDSGILLRGVGKCQANIWCWPIGCGEVYGYRMDTTMPAVVKRGATPKVNADKNIGEWNTFKITFRGERLSVELNGITVIENALMPGIPASGPIGLQHHGSKENGEWVSPPSLVQFKNIYIKEL